MLLYWTTDQMSLNAFRFSVRASTSPLMRTVPRLAVGANLAFVLLLRLVMVSSVLAYHVVLRLMWERRTLTLVNRSDMVGRAGMSDCIDLALDRGERHHSDLVDADTAGPGYDGCLWIVDQLVGRSGRSWPDSMVFCTGVVGCADFLDSVDLLPVDRSIRDQPGFMGVDFTALWP
jgi:hypothetical protein